MNAARRQSGALWIALMAIWGASWAAPAEARPMAACCDAYPPGCGGCCSSGPGIPAGESAPAGCRLPRAACQCGPAEPAAPGTATDRLTTGGRAASVPLWIADSSSPTIAPAASPCDRLRATRRPMHAAPPRTFPLLN